MNVLEKILEEIEEMRDIMESTVAMDCFGKDCEHDDCTVCVCERAMEIIRSHMNDIPDTNVGSDNDTEEKIRVHIAECLHRIDNIRSFVGSKEYINNDEKCIRNIEVLKTSIAALEEYLSLKKKNDNDGWIPVEERLPEDGDEVVLVQVSGKPKKNIEFINAFELATYGEEGWILENYPEWEKPEVAAWQPLPEPHKPKKDISVAEHIMSRFARIE